MEKRKNALLIGIFGLIIIIFISTVIKYSESALTSEEDFIKGNLRSLARKCILDEKCNKTNVTIKNLIEKGYLNKEIKDKIKKYTTDSYIVYPTYEVVLIKAD